MSNKTKIIVLLALLGVLAGIHLTRRSSSAPAASSAVGSAAGRRGAAGRSLAIPDAVLQVERLKAPAAQPRDELRRNIFEYAYRAEPPAAQTEAATAASTPPPPPPPPAAPVRFYGFAQGAQDGKRRVFLTDGEEVFILTEGDVFLRRFRLLRVQNENVEVEALEGKQRWVIPLEQP